MKPNDSFLQRMQPLEALPELLSKNERFGNCNNATLGFLLVSRIFGDSKSSICHYVLATFELHNFLIMFPGWKPNRTMNYDLDLSINIHRKENMLFTISTIVFRLLKYETNTCKRERVYLIHVIEVCIDAWRQTDIQTDIIILFLHCREQSL